LLQWLSPPDPSINLIKASKQRSKGSGSWFLNSKAFHDWKVQRNSFLWLHGIPGCGKSVLSSTIINELREISSPNPGLVLYFYFDFNDTTKQTLDGMLRSLIKQLSTNNQSGGQKHLKSLFDTCRNQSIRPTPKMLCDCFAEMLQELEQIWVVLDAMDECITKDELLEWIESLHRP